MNKIINTTGNSITLLLKNKLTIEFQTKTEKVNNIADIVKKIFHKHHLKNEFLNLMFQIKVLEI
ncbi:hypothetical protein ACV3R4_14950 [Clostridium perfringens]|uniref:hypothetical protein n=1 Tax=Clostridium perfringens TaxID=1502 RepID=UPI0026E29D63|nr:hypothetical protein [Clostridium perfringens]MDM0701863.1 hypothetical protein [Clostridium perfringens]MDO6338474.1 hypothetical protein [Clostridium perfringens]MDY2583659.1 hypothetical protein [Clostridium perfringens]HBZ6548741.1 hypothetical protein [Clostridium perfringens]